MKPTYQALTAAALLTLAAASCKKDDDTPQPVEQELITTMKLFVTDSATGASQTFTYKIENGFNATSQGTVQIDTLKLKPTATYSVVTMFLNEKTSPAEDITSEIIEERHEHLLLYASNPASGAGSLIPVAGSGTLDSLGRPFNQSIRMRTGTAGTGALTVTLIHQPTNKLAATPAAAGGETDAEGVFPVRLMP